MPRKIKKKIPSYCISYIFILLAAIPGDSNYSRLRTTSYYLVQVAMNTQFHYSFKMHSTICISITRNATTSCTSVYHGDCQTTCCCVLHENVYSCQIFSSYNISFSIVHALQAAALMFVNHNVN
jgi:hypothetical protein